jgi:uncharacterized membrane protein YgcG
MSSITNLTTKISDALYKGPTTHSAASIDVYEATFKRKLALHEPMSEADTTDPVKVAGWLQWAGSLVRRADTVDYSASCHALLNTASSLGVDNPIVLTLEKAVAFDKCDTVVWSMTCRKILAASVPNAVSQAESAISGASPRESTETVPQYFARHSIPITHAQFIRKTMGKDVSGDWLRPHLNKWASGLGNTSMAAATVTLADTATLRDFFDTVMKVSTVVPQLIPKTVMFNVIDEPTEEESATQTSLKSMGAAMESLAHSIKANSRAMNARLMVMEDKDTRPTHFKECGKCGKRGHASTECYGGGSRGGRGGSRGMSHGGSRGGGRGEYGGGRRCYNCNDEGHLSFECKKPCNICNSTEHTSAKCPRQGEKRKAAVADLSEPKNG